VVHSGATGIPPLQVVLWLHSTTLIVSLTDQPKKLKEKIIYESSVSVLYHCHGSLVDTGQTINLGETQPPQLPSFQNKA